VLGSIGILHKGSSSSEDCSSDDELGVGECPVELGVGVCADELGVGVCADELGVGVCADELGIGVCADELGIGGGSVVVVSPSNFSI